eukprot:COSAG02_NODE_8203_length_2663_cov_1.472699_3_plen_85_part_00
MLLSGVSEVCTTQPTQNRGNVQQQRGQQQQRQQRQEEEVGKALQAARALAALRWNFNLRACATAAPSASPSSSAMQIIHRRYSY